MPHYAPSHHADLGTPRGDVVKPAPFDYVAARSLDHALEVLAGNGDAKVIAGGQSLMPVLNMRLGRPEIVVDIGRLDDLARLRVDTGSLVVGAGATQTAVLSDPRVSAGWPMLTAAIAEIGHPQIRNRGTVCGSLAHNDPAAELPAVAQALDATMHVRSRRGQRTVEAADMFVGPFTTDLADDELLTEVRFPPQPAGSGWSFREFATRPGDFATVGVATRLTRRGDEVAEARIALFGIGGSARRSSAAEAAVQRSSPGPAEDAVRAALKSDLDPIDDLHASAATRLDLAEQLVIESIHEAWERSR